MTRGLGAQVRDGLDLPFEDSTNMDRINWNVWKSNLFGAQHMYMLPMQKAVLDRC